jgi:RecB family exonuclease
MPVAEPQVFPAPPLIEGQTSATNDLAALLSPSQVRTFLGCPAKWWYKYALGLADPPGASFVRGRVVHKVAEVYFRAKLHSAVPDPDDLETPFEEAWDAACAEASFTADEDVDALKAQTARLSRMYIDQVAPEIEPAVIEGRPAIEVPVQGTIAGVPVRGIIDLIDASGRIVDLKSAARTPSGVSADYAMQVATYRLIAPRASGLVRLDTLVATKTPKIVRQDYQVSHADVRHCQAVYPMVRKAMRSGVYLPNRGSNLCSRKQCNFAEACEAQWGGRVRGACDE